VSWFLLKNMKNYHENDFPSTAEILQHGDEAYQGDFFVNKNDQLKNKPKGRNRAHQQNLTEQFPDEADASMEDQILERIDNGQEEKEDFDKIKSNAPGGIRTWHAPDLKINSPEISPDKWPELIDNYQLSKGVIDGLKTKELTELSWYLTIQADAEEFFNRLGKAAKKYGKESPEYKKARTAWDRAKEKDLLNSFHKEQSDSLAPAEINVAYSLPYIIRKHNLGTLKKSHREFLLGYVDRLLKKRSVKIPLVKDRIVA